MSSLPQSSQFQRSTRATRMMVILLGMSALLNPYSTQPILEYISHWANIPPTHAAWTVSATTTGVALTAPLAGALSDRLGRRRVMVWALAAMTVTTLLPILSWSFGVLLALRFLQGICCPFVFAVAVAYLNEEFAPAVSSRLNALYVAGTAFGGFAGRMIAALITDFTGSWRLSFAGNALILAATYLVALRTLVTEQNFTPLQSHRAEKSVFARLWKPMGEFFKSALVLLKDPRILATIFIAMTLLFQQVATFTFASLALVAEPYSLPPSLLGLIVIVFLLPMVTTPQFGALQHKAGEWRSFVLSQAVSLLGLGLALIPSVGTIVAGLALSCLGVFGGQTAGTAMIARLGEMSRSTAVGMYLSGYYVGGALGALVPGTLYLHGGWRDVVLLLIAVLVAGTILGWVAWKPRVTHESS